jgi:hypothetical protein
LVVLLDGVAEGILELFLTGPGDTLPETPRDGTDPDSLGREEGVGP